MSSSRISMASASDSSSFTVHERQRRPSYTYYKRHYAIRRKTRPPSVNGSVSSERRKPAASDNASGLPPANACVKQKSFAATELKPARRISTGVQPNIAPRRRTSTVRPHPKLMRATLQYPQPARVRRGASLGASLVGSYVAGISGGDTSDDEAPRRPAR